jgi:hypothetical protein
MLFLLSKPDFNREIHHGTTNNFILADTLYQKAQRMALTLRRSLEDVLVDAVATALPPLAGLAQDLADNLADLAFQSDAELWKIARETLPPEHYLQADSLLAKKGRGTLTADEQKILERLTTDYESLILRRGQAAVLLQSRGYDMSDPVVLKEAP